MVRYVALMVVLALLLTSFPPAIAQQGGEPLRLARTSGPILWHVEDEQLRQRMENDLELLRLWNEAVAAKRRRKSLGMALFIPGAIMIGLGAAGGLFQSSIGAYDEETGDYLMIGGLALGTALAAPGVYFSAAKSRAEKAYEDYVRDTYGVVPILQFEPEPDGVTIRLGLRF